MKPAEYREARERFKFWDATMHEGDDERNDVPLLELLNDYRPYKGSKKRETFYPSDAERCPRAMYYLLTHTPESDGDVSDEGQNIFDLGDTIETMVVEKYKRLPGVIWRGVGGGFPIPGYEDRETWDHDIAVRPYLTYYLDCVWDDREGILLGAPTDIIVEIKSIAMFPFTSTKDRRREYVWYGADMVPKSDHYTQLQLYLNGEKKEYGLLHYYCKNNGQEQVYLIERDDEFLAALFDNLAGVYEGLCEGKMPDRPYVAHVSVKKDRLLKGREINGHYTKTDWHCSYCNFASRCWEIGDYQPKEEEEDE